MRALAYFLSTFLLLGLAITSAQASNCRVDNFDHNGSTMEFQMCDGRAFSIVYTKPRPGLKKIGVNDGTLLIEGTVGNNDRLIGEARIFNKLCGEKTYSVSGSDRGDTIVLRGQAPRQDANCKVVGTKADRLVFTLLNGEVPSKGKGGTSKTLQFEDYRVARYQGPSRAPDLTSHPDAPTYRTRIRNAAKEKPGFAGEYIIATWGCGANCLMGAAISAKTGAVVFLPGSICCWNIDNQDPIDYKADSKLLVLTGMIDEQDPAGTHYYEMRDGQFHSISSPSAAPNETAKPMGVFLHDGTKIQQCVQHCEGRQQLCGNRGERLGNAQGWDGDLREGYWRDTCVPTFHICRKACAN